MKKTYKPSEDELSAMLAISQRLLFDEVHEHAVDELSKRIDTMDPVKQLHLAKEHSIDDWRIPAYAKLVERADRLTLEEAQKLPLEDVLFIATCREFYRDYQGNRWLVSVRAGCQTTFTIGLSFTRFILQPQDQTRVHRSASCIVGNLLSGNEALCGLEAAHTRPVRRQQRVDF